MEPKFKLGDKVIYTGWGDIIRTTLKIGWVIEGVNWHLYQLITDDGVSVGYADERDLAAAE
jgi:hypothetical protein